MFHFFNVILPIAVATDGSGSGSGSGSGGPQCSAELCCEHNGIPRSDDKCHVDAVRDPFETCSAENCVCEEGYFRLGDFVNFCSACDGRGLWFNEDKYECYCKNHWTGEGDRNGRRTSHCDFCPDPWGGEDCNECADAYTGENCDVCKEGYWRDDTDIYVETCVTADKCTKEYCNAGKGPDGSYRDSYDAITSAQVVDGKCTCTCAEGFYGPQEDLYDGPKYCTKCSGNGLAWTASAGCTCKDQFDPAKNCYSCTSNNYDSTCTACKPNGSLTKYSAYPECKDSFNGDFNVGMFFGILFGSFAFIGCCFVALLCIYAKRQKKKKEAQTEGEGEGTLEIPATQA